MLSEQRQMQLMIKEYRDAKDLSIYDMNDVVEFAVKERGWKLPNPMTPMQLLTKKFSKAASKETRQDKITHEEYRVNHAISEPVDGASHSLWGDIDEAPRAFMLKSFIQRRQQMVGDAVQLATDVGHWNRVNPAEHPIQMEFDLRPDIEWRKNYPHGDQEAS
jgi:hypothetical protein